MICPIEINVFGQHWLSLKYVLICNNIWIVLHFSMKIYFSLLTKYNVLSWIFSVTFISFISFDIPQVRHSSVKLLESLKDLPAELFISLPSSIRLDVYDSRHNLLSNTSKMRMKTLFPDEEMPVYIAAPASYK